MSGKDKAIRSNVTVTEVSGVLDPLAIGNGLRDECGAEVTEIDASSELVRSEMIVFIQALNVSSAGSYPTDFEGGPRVIHVSFPALPLQGQRAQQLSHNGRFGLFDILHI